MIRPTRNSRHSIYFNLEAKYLEIQFASVTALEFFNVEFGRQIRRGGRYEKKIESLISTRLLRDLFMLRAGRHSKSLRWLIVDDFLIRQDTLRCARVRSFFAFSHTLQTQQSNRVITFTFHAFLYAFRSAANKHDSFQSKRKVEHSGNNSCCIALDSHLRTYYGADKKGTQTKMR